MPIYIMVIVIVCETLILLMREKFVSLSRPNTPSRITRIKIIAPHSLFQVTLFPGCGALSLSPKSGYTSVVVCEDTSEVITLDQLSKWGDIYIISS